VPWSARSCGPRRFCRVFGRCLRFGPLSTCSAIAALPTFCAAASRSRMAT